MNQRDDLINFAFVIGGLVVTLLGSLLNMSIPYIERWTRRFFAVLFTLLTAYVVSDIVSQISLEILGHGYTWLSRTAVFCESLFSSMLIPLITIYLLRCAGELKWKHPLIYAESIIWLVYFTMLIVTQFSEYIYYFTPDNVYLRGPWYPVLLVPPVLMMLLCLAAFYRYRKALTRRRRQAFACYLLIPLVCMLIQMAAYGLLMILIGTCTAALLMFVFILQEQVEQTIHQQQEIARQQQEIAHERASVMVLQMRPHFIYNTLMTIYSLCNQDPQKARQITMDFTNYLRKNFNAVASGSPIPFSVELEHTRAYLAVEHAQFEDMLLVDFDTPFTRFRLPPLTLQPIVENAVKHGMNPYSGPLRISIQTRHTDAGAQIIVEDNGIGFDPHKTNESGIALNNIRQRLKLMCRGSLTIQSQDGKGTVVQMIIPDSTAE